MISLGVLLLLVLNVMLPLSSIVSAAPAVISNPNPANGATNLYTRPTLSVTVSSTSPMNVIFQELVGADWVTIKELTNVASGTYSAIPNSMVELGTSYQWRVNVYNGVEWTYSPIYSLTTTTTVLTLKWKVGTSGGAEAGSLIGDLTNDGKQEVVRAGAGTVTALLGSTGATLWTYSNSEITKECKIYLVDLDKDGKLEIIVPLQASGGIQVLNSDGTTRWRVITSGMLQSNLVVADIDGDGYPTIFVGTAWSNTAYDNGVLSAISWDGRILYQTQIIHPCAGGLSIADYDHDGVFELYMSDRNSNYNPGGGNGVQSFWASDLTTRWTRSDILCSSSCPMLIDTNGDGLLEVVQSNNNGGLAIIDAKDGHSIRELVNNYNLVPTHYQPSICDVDGDGHLEFICSDGSHTDRNPYQTVVWDMVTWTQDAVWTTTEYSGYLGPQEADVTGDGRMEIISTTATSVYVYDHNYQQIASLPNLSPSATLSGSVAQDIDGDGYIELVITSMGGAIRAYDTPARAPAKPIRSEIRFYSERRLGAAEYVPFDEYTLTTQVSPAGSGSVAVSPLQTKYFYGTVVQLTPTNIVGYKFDHWTVDGVSAGSSVPLSLTMNTNHVVVAVFVTVPTHTLTITVSPVNSGTVAADPVGPTYSEGTVVSLTPTSASGYLFDHWVVDGNPAGNTVPLQLTMNTNHVVTAYFVVGTYDDVVFDSSFSMGNMKNPTFVSGDASGHRVYTGEEEHTTVSFADKHWWFYFSMANVAGKTVTFTFIHNEAIDFSTNPTTGNRWPEIEPVFSYDNINWQRVPLTGISFDRTAATYTITITIPSTQSKIWLAPVPPYTIERRDALIAEFASSPYLTVASLGTTPDGQLLKVVTITDPAYSDAGKFKSYVIAQQHAGELGSWAADGLIRYLLSDDPTAAAIRKSYIFRIVPIVNVDGVYEGISRYTPLRNGVQYDLNRDWSSRTQPETQWIYADIIAFQPDSFNDMHSTVNTEVGDPTQVLTYSWSTSDATLLAFRAKVKAAGFPETVTGTTSYAATIIHNALGIKESVSWELPDDEVSTNPGVKLTVNDYRSWGSAWAKGNYAYFGDAVTTYALTTLASPVSSGSVSANPTGPSYPDGTVVSLTPIAVAGYKFDHWVVDGVPAGTTVPLQVTMSAAHTVTAYFVVVPVHTLTLAVSPVSSGTIVADPTGPTYSEGVHVSLTPTPVNGKLFDYWVVDGVNAGQTVPLSITMDTDHSVTAYFKQAPGYNDVVFDSSFDMGNMKNPTFVSGDASGNRVYTGEQEHTTVSFADKHWWFYFSMANVAGKTVTFTFINNEAVDFSTNPTTGNRWPEIEPVFSYDNINWQRVPLTGISFDRTAATYTIKITLPSTQDKVWLAPIPPYNIARRDALLTEFASSPYLTVASLGTTPDGQQLKVLTITDPAYSDTGKFKSYVIAQQHAGELGSWAADGLIRYLLSNDPTAAAIRKSYIFRIVPIVNVDGVYEGISRYTPLRNGVQYDLNRDWSSRTQPETQWIWADMLAFQPDSFNDMHSTVNTEVGDPTQVLTYSWSTSDATLLAFRAKIKQAGFPETVTGTTSYAATIVHNSAALGNIKESVSWEMPDDEVSTNPGVKLTVDDWRAWGAAWAKGNYLYFGDATGALTTNVVGSGTITKNPDQSSYTYGTSIQLTANPAGGYSFSGWSGDLSGTTNPATLIFTGNSVTATFAPIGQYTLTVNKDGNGQVNLDKAGPYAPGTVVQLTAVPDSGWSFSSWSGDLTGSANPTTITMNTNKVVTAVFTQNKVSLTLTVLGGGHVDLDQAGPYIPGTVVQLTAVPDSGYTFSGWSGALTGSSNPTSLTMDADKAVTATFVSSLKLHLPFTTDTSDVSGNNNNGAITGGVTHTNNYGGAYTFDGTSGYVTVSDSTSLDGDGTWDKLTIELWVKPDSANPTAQRILRKGGTNAPYSYQIGFQTSNGHLYFDVWNSNLYEVEYTTLLSANTWYHIVCVYQSGIGSKIYVNGVDVNAVKVVTSPVGSETGLISASRGLNLYIGARFKTTSPTGPLNFFKGSLDDLQIYSDALSSTVVQQHYDATKVEHSDYTLTVNTVGSGTVTKNPDQANYAYGSSVQLTATASTGYTFSGWSGGLTGNPTTVTINGDQVITATFTQNAGSKPVINYLSLYSITDQTWLNTGDTISAGKTLRIYTGVSDADTPPAGLAVKISYGPSGGSLTQQSATYFSTWDYYYYDWAIPSGTTAGAYDVKIDVTDGVNPASSTTSGAFSIVHTLQMRLPFTTDTSDISEHSNNGVVYTGATHTNNYGGAYIFDGSTGYITVADNPDNSLDGNGAWSQLTIELWIRPDSANPTGQRLLRKGGTTTPYSYQIGFQTSDGANGELAGHLYFDVWNTAIYEVQYNTLLSANTWYHVVCVYKSGVGSKIYINGIDVGAVKVGASGSVTGLISASDGVAIYIGARYKATTPGTQNWFAGYIDDVQIYSEALTASAVQQHYVATNIDH